MFARWTQLDLTRIPRGRSVLASVAIDSVASQLRVLLVPMRAVQSVLSQNISVCAFRSAVSMRRNAERSKSLARPLRRSVAHHVPSACVALDPLDKEGKPRHRRVEQITIPHDRALALTPT